MTISDYENFGAKLWPIVRFTGACVRGVVGEPLPNIVSVNGNEYGEYGSVTYCGTLKDFTIVLDNPINGSEIMLEVNIKPTSGPFRFTSIPLDVSGDGLVLTGSLNSIIDNSQNEYTKVNVSYLKNNKTIKTSVFSFICVIK